MFAVPASPPPAIPAVRSIVATTVLSLFHEPPEVVLASVTDDCSQTCRVPVMPAGVAFTETSALVLQPVGSVYSTVAVPFNTPATMPVEAVIVATDGDRLLQEPPAVTLARLVVAPSQTTCVPVMAAGEGFTVSVADLLHPLARVYIMDEVPAALLVAMPDDALMAAAEVLVLDHVPPVIVLLRVVVNPPSQTSRVPEIAAGDWLTVTTAVL